MRKSWIIMAVLLALSVTLIVSAVVVMADQHDTIVVQEQTLRGDPAAAEGLTIVSKVLSGRHLVWETTYQAGSDPRPKTAFSYHDQAQYPVSEAEGWFTLDIAGINYGMSGTVDLEAAVNLDNYEEHGFHNNMLLPALDVSKEVKANEELTKQVRLSDYYEYFPVDANYSLINPAMRYRGNSLMLYKFFNDYFRIPVPEELLVDVTVSKDEAGQVYNVDMYESSGEISVGTTAWTSSVVTEEGVFFGLFGNADFSEIKGGYGLYWVPVEFKEGDSFATGVSWGTSADTVYLREECCNIYPMEPSGQEGNLYVSEDGSRLFALIWEQDTTRMVVFDAATRQVLQELDLGMKKMPTLWHQENLFVLLNREGGKDRMQVWLLQDGRLELWLETEPYPFGPDASYGWYQEPELCFNGEKLAINRYRNDFDRATSRLQIYDQTGLLYVGDYYHNGDTLPERLEVWNHRGPDMYWDTE